MADPQDDPILSRYAPREESEEALDQALLRRYANPKTWLDHPALRTLRRSSPDVIEQGYNPIWDIILPSKGDVEQPRERYVKATKEPVLPSREFWEKLGAGPSWVDRQGRAQAAAIGAVNGLLFGAPMAAARRFAPQAAEDAQAVLDQNYYSGVGGELSAAILNPANKALRTGGEWLARRGYGLTAQGTADGLSAATAYSIPALIEDQRPNTDALTHVLPVAYASRLMMPYVPSNTAKRALYGALGGGAYGLVPGNGLLGPLPDAMLGALYGAALKRPKNEHLNSTPEKVGTYYTRYVLPYETQNQVSKGRNQVSNMAMIGGGLTLAPYVLAQPTSKDKREQPDLPTLPPLARAI